MAYDEKISTTVSLSRVLDELIDSNESIAVIISFLKDHDDDFTNIIMDSLSFAKIYQLDFILQCNDEERAYLLKKFKSIPARIAAYCAWQVCKSESKIADSIKYLFRQEFSWRFSWILANFQIPHPYGSFIGKDVFRKYDYKLFNAALHNSIAEELLSWPDNLFVDFAGNISNSLFMYRICQYDVFSQLTEVKKFFLLAAINGLKHSNINFMIRNFIVQILKSDECVSVKHFALQYLDNCLMDEVPESDLVNCKSFSELMMKLTIYGVFDYTKIITYLFSDKKYGILHDWLMYDEKLFTEDFNAKDIITLLYNETKSTKRKNT